ncbi:unnamed protein product [Brassicogethes aeneus]|uniref:Uncharacterized protein n=1 Tax=Brassicogethes aeneus TaxID=1431903 RepID=A0A9P0BD20_BRAAE|nr:unnamed protein product [Brassicogethes aeneus]
MAANIPPRAWPPIVAVIGNNQVAVAVNKLEIGLALAGLAVPSNTLSKVFPSPGAARSVWALPQTSCNMVADTDHPAASVTHHHHDGGTVGLGEADIAEQQHKSIFDLVKAG